MNRTKITDWLTGKNVWGYYKLYSETQWYSREEMREFQIRKLKKLLNHCYENVPYYKDIIDEKKIDIKHFNTFDVLKEFPVMTKEVIQSNYKALTPLNNDKIKGVKTSQTGGTTGNILFKRNDGQTRSSAWATYKRFQDWMGISGKENTLILMGGHVVHRSFKDIFISSLSATLRKSVHVDIYNTSDHTIERVIELLKSNHFTHIRSYPQFLYSVAQKLDALGLQFPVRSITTTAEPVIEEHRQLFRKIFNCEVFDQYGCGEIGGIAYECDLHEGLHIAEERAIVEVNEFNELIITDLDNFTMPFIRYWNADQAIIGSENCSCGRKSPLFKQIMGRTCDYVVGLEKQFLHWAYFWHLIFDSNVAKNRNLKKFQIVQEDNETIIIKLVADELSQSEQDFIIANMQERLGLMKIEFTYHKNIENAPSGKYRPVINKLLISHS